MTTNSDTSGGSPSGAGGRDDVRGRAVFRGEADAEAIIESIERARHPVPAEEIEADEPSRLQHQQVSRPERLKLPGFGEPEDDCGEYILPALRFCVNSGRTHEFKHNCYRYDCPMHGPYAARRRAAGSADAAGIAAKLKSLQLRLYKARGTDHYFHHLFVSIPDDYYLESDEPLERLKEVIREIMDELGAQGFVGYHPMRGGDEDKKGDDRGFWKDLLFHLSDWDDAQEMLEFGPHFHLIVVAPHIDVSVTEAVEEATGWVIHRRTDENGISLYNAQAMANALTYNLSHCGIYETESGQRRLAAWMKGPDVADTPVYPQTREEMRAAVNEAAEDTLGIPTPNLECDCDFHQAAEQVDPAIGDVESGAVSMAHSGPLNVATKPLADPQAVHGPGELASGTRTDLPPPRPDLPDDPDADLEPRTLFRGSDDDGEHVQDVGDDDGQDAPTCGAYLKHISKAGEYLLDGEWREKAPYADDLDGAYRDYISYMTSRDLDPLDDLPSIPEESGEDPDAPPPG